MHDAVVRCLASMVALGHVIKPTVAIESAAVSTKAAQVGGAHDFACCLLSYTFYVGSAEECGQQAEL
jgi:hypothetical protein